MPSLVPASQPALRLFGTPQLNPQGGPAHLFRPQRPYQALAFLACRCAWVPRAELASWLWPEHEPALARKNLRKVLVQAREIAGDGLEVQGELLRWLVDSDVRRFEAACAAASDEEVVQIYGAPLLQGLEPGLGSAAREWLQDERTRLQQRWRAAMLRSIQRLAGVGTGALDEAAVRAAGPGPDLAAEVGRAGELASAAARCERLVAADPLDDEAVGALVALRSVLGQRGAALRVLDEHERRLADSLGLEPSAALRRARQCLLAPSGTDVGAPAAAQGAAQARPSAGPTPTADDAFVGRRVEVLQLRDLLARPACRLLTITGPGGIGKTRLARRAVAELAPRFMGGAYWISGAGLNDAAQLGQRLAAALELALRGELALWLQIAHGIGARSVLAVLDNVEQVEGAAAALHDLLVACPGLKLLVTSRERLGIDGEWLLPLQGLPLPDIDEQETDVLRSFDAVRLFELRARMHAPAFDFEAQAAGVVRLLHAVQGLPLAIEIAAPWARLLPAAQIADEIERSGELLAGRGAGGLDDSFDISWRRLSDDERAALVRLAALPDACDLEMARQVAEVALPVLAALADKSLLQAQDSGRFGLHPLIRQCALARAGVPDIVRQRHAEHVARWLERLGESAGSTRWRDIERSMVHLRSAWAWALAQRQGELVSRSARALMLYFEGQGLWAEGMILLAGGVDAFGAFEACARDGDLAGAAALCHCLRALATLQYRAGELEGAESSARRGLRLAQRLRDGRAVKANLNTLGLSLWLRGRFREAQPCFAQALRRAERDNDTPGAAVFIGNLAMVETALGNYAQAVALYERSLAGDRSLRTPASLANTLNNAANAARALDAREHAHARLAEALALCERHQLRSVRPFVLVNLGVLDLEDGQTETARRWLEQAAHEAQSHGGKVIAIECALWQAVLEGGRGAFAAAAALLRAALANVHELRSPALELRWLAVFARWSAERGALDDAGRALRLADARPGLSALDREDALRGLPLQLRRRIEPAAVTPGLDDMTAGAPAASAPNTRDACPLAWARERLDAYLAS